MSVTVKMCVFTNIAKYNIKLHKGRVYNDFSNVCRWWFGLVFTRNLHTRCLNIATFFNVLNSSVTSFCFCVILLIHNLTLYTFKQWQKARWNNSELLTILRTYDFVPGCKCSYVMYVLWCDCVVVTEILCIWGVKRTQFPPTLTTPHATFIFFLNNASYSHCFINQTTYCANLGTMRWDERMINYWVFLAHCFWHIIFAVVDRSRVDITMGNCLFAVIHMTMRNVKEWQIWWRFHIQRVLS